MSYTYEYPHPAVTVDCVLFGLGEDKLQLLLIERGLEPFKGSWALPGGFVKMDEDSETAARRELAEETGVNDVYLEQLYTFSKVERDPRERVISISYYGLIKPQTKTLSASTDAVQARWFNIDELPEMAFDHAEIVDKAMERLKGKVKYQPIGFELLPDKFTLPQLQKVYEIVLQRDLDKRNFRKKIQKTGLILDTGEMEENVARRPAKFYQFDKQRYEELCKNSYLFEI
ncbi:MAG: NUDIX hydrolase [Lentisphaeraceae bacterium]|nr:NUDIX hydrolase [Lentisphaeraceae bacterium]